MCHFFVTWSYDYKRLHVRKHAQTGNTVPYVYALLLEQHLAFDVLVVRALGARGRAAGELVEWVVAAFVEDEHKLVRHLLLDFDDLVVADEVECCWLRI